MFFFDVVLSEILDRFDVFVLFGASSLEFLIVFEGFVLMLFDGLIFRDLSFVLFFL